MIIITEENYNAVKKRLNKRTLLYNKRHRSRNERNISNDQVIQFVRWYASNFKPKKSIYFKSVYPFDVEKYKSCEIILINRFKSLPEKEDNVKSRLEIEMKTGIVKF